jgi:WD domain, G-beta repeat
VAFSPDGTRLVNACNDGTARLWDARIGQQLLELRGHTGRILNVAFSANGTRLVTASENGTVRLWDARPVNRRLDTEELSYRLWATRSDPSWHEEQFKRHQTTDRFAATFHLDRLLAYRPAQRSSLLRQRTAFLEATLMQSDKDAAARLLLARTAWHSPALGPKDAASLLPTADDQQPFAQRTRGGLLLRLKKAAEAVPVLEAALMKERGDDKPPVEELLLAWAYLDTNQPDKAKEQWTKATAWLDRKQEKTRFDDNAPTTDPRYNAFGWETWDELDVLRRELTPLCNKAIKP